ncbi:MAG: acyl-CoA dehydrogenase family protein [Hyphomicrobiales bacterium]|nr:acyl-CoA dehydrogenase family protein [Hyphomicrobiales bacterium]MCP5372513.1 acyl-CoA dehydrogenase family protein [Hyphomicrobiales bacterium]
MLTDAFAKLLAEHCGPQVVRAAEAGEDVSDLWRAFEDSGFLDALVAEDAGGAGLGLTDVAGLVLAAGRAAVPLPFAQTMIARAALAEAGVRAPAGRITLAAGRLADGAVTCPAVPFGLVADWVVADLGGTARLVDCAAATVTATGVYGSLTAAVRGPATATVEADVDWAAAGAAVHAGLLAGAMEAVMAMTLDYAAQRNQFGRPITRFQAVQQQLSVMAEEVFAARMAAQFGLRGPSFRPGRLQAAMAKARTSEAAPRVAAVGHAVHGAIGMTQELDLQLHTRRLREWRSAHGSESHWNAVVGRALLAAGDTGTLDFVRAEMFPPL